MHQISERTRGIVYEIPVAYAQARFVTILLNRKAMKHVETQKGARVRKKKEFINVDIYN